MATRTLSFERALPLTEPLPDPLVEAMRSFRLDAKGISSASESVRSTRSLTLRFRRRAASLSSRRSSGGMRSTTAPAAPGIAFRRRPLGVNETPKRSAKSATTTSFRFDSRRATSRTTVRLSAGGIRTRIVVREVLADKLLALYRRLLARAGAELAAHVQDPLHHREPRGRCKQTDRPRQHTPGRERDTDGNRVPPLGAGADADVALDPEAFRLRPRVRNEEGAAERRDGERERELLAVAHEDERDRAEHHSLADAVERRVEEAAERGLLATRPRERAVEDVEDRADDEREPAEEEQPLGPILEVDEHGADDTERHARRCQHVRGHEGAGEARH